MLGIPYNIASYALLLELIAREVGMVAYELVLTTVDSHVYKNHIKTAKNQIRRKIHKAPKLVIDPKIKKLSDFDAKLVRLEGYEHGPKTDYPVAV